MNDYISLSQISSSVTRTITVMLIFQDGCDTVEKWIYTWSQMFITVHIYLVISLSWASFLIAISNDHHSPAHSFFHLFNTHLPYTNYKPGLRSSHTHREGRHLIKIATLCERCPKRKRHLTPSMKAQKDWRQFISVCTEWTCVSFSFSISVTHHSLLFSNRIFFWETYSFPNRPGSKVNPC